MKLHNCQKIYGKGNLNGTAYFCVVTEMRKSPADFSLLDEHNPNLCELLDKSLCFFVGCHI